MKYIASCFLCLAASAGMLSATPVTTVRADVVNAGTPLLDQHHDFVGPYTLNVNGTNYSALCIDFEDNATLGQTYSAYETQLSSNNLSDTYHPTWSIQYKEEAYLLSLILQPHADRIDIQHAAWAITDSSYHANSAAESFVHLAMANYNSLDFSKFEIISGKEASDCNRAQEFIIDPSANVTTPEPASVLLMGGGLLAAGLARRKMVKKA